MSKVNIVKSDGAKAGSIDLDESIFGIEPNIPVMHQVVTGQLAAKRSGTHNTKTRAEIRGGAAKPWKQKGTGRARAGSSNMPHWRGGGVAMGPKPRNYAQKTPKKMKRLALFSALSDRAASDNILIVDTWDFESPSTSRAQTVLNAIGATGKVLLVIDANDTNTEKSFRNLPNVHVLPVGQLNVFDILVSDYVVFTKDNLPTFAKTTETNSMDNKENE